MNQAEWLISLAQDESKWRDDMLAVSSVPSMIVQQYSELHRLAREGNVYGSLLQMRDTYETLIKVPVLMAYIALRDTDIADSEEYRELIFRLLSKPLAMGDWHAMARAIDRSESLALPDALLRILHRTGTLFNERVSEHCATVVKWRNDSIGHGILRFEDDDRYIAEYTKLLELLYEYFGDKRSFALKNYYDTIYFHCGELRVCGNIDEASLTREMSLRLDDRDYDIQPYADVRDLRAYFFESYYAGQHQSKYANFHTGHSYSERDEIIQNLISRYENARRNDHAIRTDFLTQGDEQALDLLTNSDIALKPEHILAALQEQFEELRKGVILLEMERGTGKTFLTNHLDGRYTSNPWIPNATARVYHLGNLQLRGRRDFINALNFIFRTNRNSADFIRESDMDLNVLTEDSTPQDIADYLKLFRDYYDEDYTILILDGIDELTADTRNLLSLMPTRDMLARGIFILMTSRTPQEDTLRGLSKELVSEAEQLADATISIEKNSEDNRKLLEKYVSNYCREHNLAALPAEERSVLVRNSDYRFLFLKAALALYGRLDLSGRNESEVVSMYIDYLDAGYSRRQQDLFHRLCLDIAVFSPISLSDYGEYLCGLEVTYQLVGILNDMMPLLTVTRDNGVNVYEFANTEYRSHILSRFGTSIPQLITEYENSFVALMSQGMDEENTHGVYYEYSSENIAPALRNKHLAIVSRLWELLQNVPDGRTVFAANESFLYILGSIIFSSEIINNHRSVFESYFVGRIREILSASVLTRIQNRMSIEEFPVQFLSVAYEHTSNSPIDAAILQALNEDGIDEDILCGYIRLWMQEIMLGNSDKLMKIYHAHRLPLLIDDLTYDDFTMADTEIWKELVQNPIEAETLERLLNHLIFGFADSFLPDGFSLFEPDESFLPMLASIMDENHFTYDNPFHGVSGYPDNLEEQILDGSLIASLHPVNDEDIAAITEALRRPSYSEDLYTQIARMIRSEAPSVYTDLRVAAEDALLRLMQEARYDEVAKLLDALSSNHVKMSFFLNGADKSEDNFRKNMAFMLTFLPMLREVASLQEEYYAGIEQLAPQLEYDFEYDCHFRFYQKEILHHRCNGTDEVSFSAVMNIALPLIKDTDAWEFEEPSSMQLVTQAEKRALCNALERDDYDDFLYMLISFTYTQLLRERYSHHEEAAELRADFDRALTRWMTIDMFSEVFDSTGLTKVFYPVASYYFYRGEYAPILTCEETIQAMIDHDLKKMNEQYGDEAMARVSEDSSILFLRLLFLFIRYMNGESVDSILASYRELNPETDIRSMARTYRQFFLRPYRIPTLLDMSDNLLYNKIYDFQNDCANNTVKAQKAYEYQIKL